MAAGDIQVLDDVEISFGGTSLEDYVSQVRLQVTNPVVAVPNTFGRAGPLRAVSDKHDWSIEVTFETDGWGGTTVDAVIQKLMQPPLGSANGAPEVIITPNGGTVSDTNPSFTGKVAIGEWEPLGGSGTVNERVSQTRTFMGAGPLVKATS